MIAVVVENRALRAALASTISALNRAGEAVETWELGEEPGEFLQGDLDDETVADVCGYQRFAQAMMTNKAYWCHWYDDFEASAQHWHKYMCWRIEKAKPQVLVTWGSSYLANRAAIRAAQSAGIPVACVEEGMFRTTASERQLLVTPGKAYYEHTPEEFTGWRTHETDTERLESYREWWLMERATKHAHSVNMETELPECWEASEQRLMWFGQLFWDAAAFWGMNDAQKAKLQADVLSGSDCACGKAAGAFYKDHPHAIERPVDPRFHVIQKCASIHQLVPRSDVVAVVNSTVGVEAMMFRESVPVAVYGDPFYAQGGLVGGNIQHALSHTHAAYLRDCFLDHLIHECHVNPQADPKAFAARVRDPVF